MRKTAILLLCAVLSLGAYAAADTARVYRFRVSLADKKNNPYSLKHPEKFLSPKSLERRAKFKIKLDAHDLPVTPAYVDGLRRAGMSVLNMSKWNNTVLVETTDSAAAVALTSLPYVSAVRLLWAGQPAAPKAPKTDRHDIVTNRRDTLDNYYGRAVTQVEMLGVDKLHAAGFRGAGVTIAVVDGGFYNADCLDALRGCKILGTRNFVHPGRSVYEEQSHGMQVLSCIGSRWENAIVGTAPDASFYLLVSEDGGSESLVEEDNWCAAIEYADSVGADIVTSSLGYYEFDNPADSYRYRDLDGRTAAISRAASLAAGRGMVVVNSAGNSGDEPWKKISVPADATDILTVGAVDADRTNTNFSSLGPAADGRVKPDVAAMGGRSAVLLVDGTVGAASGTSFSAPILCGAVACLWQACPGLSPVKLMDAVRRSGDRADYPDNVYGYGIPNVWNAYQKLMKK